MLHLPVLSSPGIFFNRRNDLIISGVNKPLSFDLSNGRPSVALCQLVDSFDIVQVPGGGDAGEPVPAVHPRESQNPVLPQEGPIVKGFIDQAGAPPEDNQADEEPEGSQSELPGNPLSSATVLRGEATKDSSAGQECGGVSQD